MTPFELIISGLAGYRLALLLVREEGPWMVFHRIRQWAGTDEYPGRVPFAGILSCVWCCSLYGTTAAAILLQIHPATYWFVTVVAAMSLPVLLDVWASSRNQK